ncbi:protein TRIGALACTOSYLDIACYLGLYCEROL 4 [Pyrus ussuriensis x Pyrus communis]|uniref:Protein TRIGALACTOSYLDIACYLGLYCEROL 4 n=1 Tax=Pyrus ussuriensis x Pyrus communis TaxID=2448454 RepID=A0A5N5HRI0_9ROSA|nr:protein TRIGALACTOSYLDIACYLGLYCEROL 4 [Pyrus ussuriensis x Pyrus communis]KAB2637671.1 protein TRIGALACTOSYLDIACYLGLYCEROL 4 [Pyrus ussuriensis x Pyrus communis]
MRFVSVLWEVLAGNNLGFNSPPFVVAARPFTLTLVKKLLHSHPVSQFEPKNSKFFEIPDLPRGRDEMGGSLHEDDLLGPGELAATGEAQRNWVVGNGSNQFFEDSRSRHFKVVEAAACPFQNLMQSFKPI